MQAAVRQVADEYLADPNITSVGLGYELKDGKRTDRLSLQFTVGQKIAPEALGAAPTRPIPERITVNGITFVTDVVERDFRPQPVSVKTPEKSARKQRSDPLRPGISIGHVRSTAGTLGCLVQEAASGELRLLSNWHVFQGEDGDLGDEIAQPGPHDDNRVSQNVCATLERSFLGLAGDCAIARLSARTASEEILDLGVPVREIADPELDDLVVKSGRTTDVTHGRVTRIHTISSLKYGSKGEQRIGGFEIGPDEARPAPNGEISMGGDSGSAWMATDESGDATDLMLGLHFGGEAVEPAEYALACYASSVFEKLEIRPLEPPSDGEATLTTAAVVGFDSDFLSGRRIELPEPAGAEVREDIALTTAGDPVRHYTHFSLAMSAGRRFCRWVAWNIDGTGLRQLPRKGIDFVIDPAYRAEDQVDDALYSRNSLDRGHIARRADLLWGDAREAERANVDSFFFTNITPQLDDFNQSGQRGLWGQLEDAVYADTEIDDLRVSVLGGPIFKTSDFRYREILIPRSFWKIIAYVEEGTLRAKAFVLTQDDLEEKLESLGLEPFRVYQLALAELAKMALLDFGDLTTADTMSAAPEAIHTPRVRRIKSRADIVTG